MRACLSVSRRTCQSQASARPVLTSPPWRFPLSKAADFAPPIPPIRLGSLPICMPKCFAEDLSESSFGPSSPYFSTMAIPLVQGRGFRPTDTADSPRVAIGNEHFVKTYYPGFDPIGKRFLLGGQRGDWVEVVRAASGADLGSVALG